MITNSTGWHVLPPIPPFCKEVRTRCRYLRDASPGRILLQHIEDPTFLINAPADSFVADVPTAISPEPEPKTNYANPNIDATATAYPLGRWP